jgi:hypothetical protein
MNKNQSLFAILLVASLFSSSLLAELPSWYPQDYDLVGIVDEVNAKTIYIDDNKIAISPTIKYATENNSNASIRQLKKGLLVGVNILTINNRNLVDRIWLIPESQRKKYRPLQ